MVIIVCVWPYRLIKCFLPTDIQNLKTIQFMGIIYTSRNKDIQSPVCMLPPRSYMLRMNKLYIKTYTKKNICLMDVV